MTISMTGKAVRRTSSPSRTRPCIRTQTGVIGGIGGITDEAKLSMDNSCFAMGQSAGGVHEVKPVAAIVDDIMRDAEASIDRMASLKVKETA